MDKSLRPTLLGLLFLLAIAGFGIWIGYAVRALPMSQDVQHPEMNTIYGAVRVWRGETPFPDTENPPFWISLYTPLYFLLVGGLGKLGAGDVAGVVHLARALSVLSTLFCAVAVAGIAVRCGARRAGGAAAAGLFLSSALLIPWGFMGRVDLLALAFTLGALWMAVSKRFLPATILALAAFFTKQSFIAAPIAIGILSWRSGHRRIWIVFPAAAALLAGILQTASGGTFLDHTVFRVGLPFRAANIPEILEQSWLTLSAPLVLAAMSGSVRTGPRGLIATWGLLAGAIGIASMLRVGSDRNYLLEVAAALAVLAGGLIPRWGKAPMIGLALAIALLAWDTERRFRGPVRYLVGTEPNQEAVEAARPGLTFVANPNIAVRSGQETFVSDPFLHAALSLRGEGVLARLKRDLSKRRFDRLVMDYCSRRKRMPNYQGISFWDPETIRLIDREYREIREVDGYCVYVRRR